MQPSGAIAPEAAPVPAAAPGPRRDGKVTARRMVLWALLLGVLVAAWAPFRLEAPVWRRERPERTPEALRFDGRAVLSSDVAVRALIEGAKRDDRMRVEVDARSASPDQTGPARLLSISHSVHEANVMVGQDGADLVVRLRRPTSQLDGEPAFRVDGVFSDGAWHAIDLDITEASISLRVDDIDVVSQPAQRALAGWDEAQTVSLGDEASGDRGWRGEIRDARLSSDDHTVDLVAATAMGAPDDLVVSDRVKLLGQFAPKDPPLLSLFRVVTWALIGFLARPRRLLPGLALLLFPLTLTLGKVFVAGRDPRFSDVVLAVSGLAVGIALAALASRSSPRRARSPGPVAVS
jgi:hypothetical protein